MDARARADRELRKRELLLREFKAGIWSKHGYHRELKKMKREATPEPSPSEHSTPPPRQNSPNWQLNENGSLFDEDEDEDEEE